MKSLAQSRSDAAPTSYVGLECDAGILRQETLKFRASVTEVQQHPVLLGTQTSSFSFLQQFSRLIW
jgi:hypothetical protein